MDASWDFLCQPVRWVFVDRRVQELTVLRLGSLDAGHLRLYRSEESIERANAIFDRSYI